MLARFGLAGLANTALGYSVIVAALLAGVGDYLANAIGYLAGFALSFVLNRRFTFRVRAAADRAEIVRFGVAVICAYAANLVVLGAGRSMLGPDNALAHLPAICAYTAVFFLLSAYFVFPSRSRA